MPRKFSVRLKTLHDQTGLSVYAVAKSTGLVWQTVRKFVTQEEVITDSLYPHVVTLAEFYGVDWKDIVEVIDDTPEIKTPLPEAV